MDAIEQLRQDFREGRLNVDRLFDVIVALQRQLESAKQRIEEFETKLGTPATAKINEAFSMRAEEKRQQARLKQKKRKPARKSRRGRITTAEKLKLAERTECCFPDGVPQHDCWLSHSRPVWRLENGRAILIAYQIYRGPKNQYGKIPGVLGRSEIGLEIVVEIAYLVYGMGLSMDKVCQLLQFLQHLRLGKTQADALLRQLSRHWQHEFDVLCTLLANSLVVHTDETSWSINSVWAFLSEKARVVFFGVHKDADTLEQMLEEDRVGLPRVCPPHHDDVGVLDLRIGGGAAAASERGRQARDARRVARAVAGVHVVRADDDARELLRHVVHLVGRPCARQHREGVGPAGVHDALESLSGAVQCLVPGGRPQPAVVAY